MKRYREVARLLLELRSSGLELQGDPDDGETSAELRSPAGKRRADLSDGGEKGASGDASGGDVEKAERLAAHLEEMGPTFVKLGQLLSTRPDLLAPAYIEALSRLQENVRPFPFEEVREAVEEELGVRLSKVFQEFDPAPLAAASLGQVHRATLRDGRLVAVKVLRPGVLDRVPRDLRVIEELVSLVDNFARNGGGHDIRGFLEEFEKALLSELDYRKEADHLMVLRENMAEIDGLVIPAPIPDLSSRRILTMEYMSGRSVAEMGSLARLEVDSRKVLDTLFRAYLKQALVDGFVHADPHPGNIVVSENGSVVLLDAGQVLHLPDEVREGCLRILEALASGDGEETARRMERLGATQQGFARETFRRRISETVSRLDHHSVLVVEPGHVLMQLARTADDEGLRLPPQFALLAKTLVSLDRVAQILDPSFDSAEAVRRHMEDLAARRVLSSIPQPGDILSSMAAAKGVVERLPARLERVLEVLERNDFRVQVKVSEWERMMRVLHRSAAHISAGLVLASLIVGASFLMRVETDFTVFGYPGLAITFFLLAAVGGIALVVYILWGEHHHGS